MEPIELKHCPFCGGAAEITDDIRFGTCAIPYRVKFVRCIECYAQTSAHVHGKWYGGETYCTDEELIEEWNCRYG